MDASKKNCSKCRQAKSLDAFNGRTSAKDGRDFQCKDCRHAYRVANAAKISAYNAEFGKTYRAEHSEQIAERKAEYQSRAPHVGWLAYYKFRAIRAGFTPVVESFTKQDVIDRYGDACAYCGGPFEHLDHVKPVAKGGEHTLANVRPACAACNRSKNAGYGDPEAVAS